MKLLNVLYKLIELDKINEEDVLDYNESIKMNMTKDEWTQIGIQHSWKLMRHSIATKKKISESKMGSQSSNKGKFYMIKLEGNKFEQKLISSTERKQYESNGWIKIVNDK